MRRAHVLALALVAALPAAARAEAPSRGGPSAAAPNVIIILADDLGYGDLGTFGSPRVRTPSLDRLAAEGIKLTSFYVPAPICAPSRAALMTGRYPYRTGITWNGASNLKPDERTMGDMLRARGYRTIMIGKWHLGIEEPEQPQRRGFDEYYGILEGVDTAFFRSYGMAPDSVEYELLTRRYTAEAVAAIRASKDRPFFLYLAHHAPHAPNGSSSAFKGHSGAGVYGDTVEELDWSVGQVMAAVREAGIDRRTLVVFLSDNGAVVPPLGPGSSAPLHAGKGVPYEGGVRVPAIAWMPTRIPAGRVSAEPLSSLDLLPTIATLTGASPPAGRRLDGLDVSRVLTGEVPRLAGTGIDGGRELLFWYGGIVSAFRSGRWKYVASGFWDGNPGLFDLEADPGESRNLKDARPEITAAMRARIEALVGGL